MNKKLSWERSDWERKFGLAGGKYTAVNQFFTFMLGLVFGLSYYAAIYPLYKQGHQLGDMFYERGSIPYFVVFFTSWSLAILLIKYLKIRLQCKSLKVHIVPQDPSYKLTPETTSDVLNNIYDSVDNPRHFMLFNRIELALSNLKNIGRIGDVDEILRSHAENDENYVESSYTQLKGFIWAIPVLGFIGTVMGLSSAIGGFGGVLANSEGIAQIKEGLKGVTGGLSTAFDTTLIALVAALLVQMIMTNIKKKEEDFLDDCTDYCMRHVVARLRLSEKSLVEQVEDTQENK